MRELIDCHVHTARCGHAAGSVDDCAAAAIAAGLSAIVFTEHLPMPEGTDPDYEVSPPLSELGEYLDEVDAARTRYPQLEVVTGVEADYLPGRSQEAAAILSQAKAHANGATVIVGSVHLLGSWTFDDPRSISSWAQRDVDAAWEEYFRTWCDACASGAYDVMAHPDLVKKFGHRPVRDVSDLYEEAAQAAGRAGVIVEVSTAGLRKPVGELYPGPELLRRFREAGVEATVGSDAHDPSEVGYRIDDAYRALVEAGYDHVVLPLGRETFRRVEL